MSKKQKIQHVFIIGSKGIPAQYGGYETFVEKLTQYKKSELLQYHVACAYDRGEAGKRPAMHNGAHCMPFLWKKCGAAKAVIYDLEALHTAIRYVKAHKISKPIFYILACRIGPFIGHFKRQIERLGGMLLVNPDGHEWKRAKWNAFIRHYWKLSERFMVKHADLLICDSRLIEYYIQKTYRKYHPETIFISYGTDLHEASPPDASPELAAWFQANATAPGDYYLIVGRFVPENNYETMLREFMKSSTAKKLVVITQASGKFYKELLASTGFTQDDRIKFAGTVYDAALLRKIRENAFAYLHGHEVGGTNPTLLESLASTRLNLVLSVGFNEEVAGNTALYWNKKSGSLSSLIVKAEEMDTARIDELGRRARRRVEDRNSWAYIVNRYEMCFDRLISNGGVEEIDEKGIIYGDVR
ncbi:MAG: beta 1-4 rhamnosyltransferase Cps2T [Lachnospiraceae bacterium]